MNVVVKNASVLVATDLKHEHYALTIRTNGKWELSADYYVGFLRGVETYSQLFEEEGDERMFLRGTPILIDDNPTFLWRGLMIDSSRHFLPVEDIKKTIDGMLYNKLNVLHWHIVDEDAFPLLVPSRPELSEFGQVGGVYTVADVKTVIVYAQARGIRVIPEIDSPAHTESWGRSEKNKKVTFLCDGIYVGQFDPTLNETYDLVDDVLRHVTETFPDNYVHFGGDEIDLDCWDQRPSIAKFMEEHSIKTFRDLEVYYREEQKRRFRKSISSTKKVIYWANEEIDLPVQADDVIQWWGVSKNVDHLAGRKNEVILSNYDLTYMDIGFGGRTGGSYGHYQNWRLMYSFNPRVANVNVIGGEVCMWSELNSRTTHELKIWHRSSVMGERLWNTNITLANNLNNIATRLVSQSRRMRARGFKVSPVTVGLCEKNMTICY